MRSPQSTVPAVRVMTNVVAVSCSQCGPLPHIFPGRMGADLLAKKHRESHAAREVEGA